MRKKELPIGAIILEPGSAARYKTGVWRSVRPMIDEGKCTKCQTCWVLCPDIAIKLKEDGSVEVDLDYCKGCGICAEECPVKAIMMVEEVGV